MFERAFSLGGIIAILGAGLVALGVAATIGLVKKEGSATNRRFEAIPLAILGALLARLFVSALIALGNESPGTCLLIGWGFGLWPGVVDTIPFLAGSGPILTDPDVLTWIATGVGGFAGMMDGLFHIHDWTGLGYLSFPLDVTWGLGATTNGCLMHVWNAIGGTRSTDERTGAHRYENGFHFKKDFAFTQGAVMSELKDAPGTPLFRHERLHVWQNRIFGPLFLLSYLSWAVVWFIPSLIAGGVKGSFGTGPQEWCYMNNPWEAWAYAIQNQDRSAFTDMNVRLIWPARFVIAWSIPFFAIVTAVSLFATYSLWIDAPPMASAASHSAAHGKAPPKPPAKPGHK